MVVNPYITIILFLFVLYSSLLSQVFNLKFDHLDVEKGLSNNTVRDIAVDGRGYIWLATEDGLNRYNGYEFEVFKADPGDSSSLYMNDIEKLHVDSYGRIWVEYDDGECVSLYLNNRRFFNIYPVIDKSEKSYATIGLALQDSSGYMWLQEKDKKTTRAFIKVDIKTLLSTRVEFNSDASDSVEIYKYGAVSKDSSVIFLTGEGILEYDNHSGKFILHKNGYQPDKWLLKQYSNKILEDIFTNQLCFNTLKDEAAWYNPDFIQKECNSVPIFFIDNKNDIWLNEKGMINKLAGESEELKLELEFTDLDNDYGKKGYYLIWQDIYDNYWFGNFYQPTGLYQYSGDRLIHHKHNPFIANSLSYNKINNLLVQLPDGNYIIPTEQRGAEFINAGKNRFKYLTSVPGYKNSLSDKQVRSITKIGKYTVIGTRGGGINFYNEETGENLNPSLHFNGKEVKNVECLEPLENEKLLIGSKIYGLFLYDFNSRALRRIKISKTNFNLNEAKSYIRKIAGDGSGNFYIATMEGLSVLNRDLSLVREITFDEYNKTYYSIFDALPAGRNLMYIATNRALLASDSLGNIVKEFNHKNTGGTLSDEDKFCLLKDSKNRLWCGTFGAGLEKLNEDGHTFTTYRMKDGLAGDVVYGIIEDEEGYLWISTGSGLSRFDPETETFNNYYIEDGLPGNAFEFGAYYQSGNEIYLGTMNGVVKFRPSEISPNSFPSPVYLTGFDIANRKIYGEEIKEIDRIRLSYRDNIFTFHYTGINYSSPERTTYKYKMEGLNEEWIYAEKSRKATFTNIDHGQYLFKVKAVNEDGIESRAGAAIPLIISPPFWVTWWFRGVVIFIITTLLYLLYLYRIKQLRKVELLRLKIANDLHDEIGSNLGSITLMSKMLKRENRPELADKIYYTSMKTASSIRDIVWFINQNNDDTKKIIRKMRSYCGDMLVDVDYSFNLDDERIFNKLDLDQKRHVYLVLREAVHNIVKHSEADKVEIRFQKTRLGFVMTIGDNGKGFENNQSLGTGIQSMKQRAKEINADFKINSNPGKGTIIQLVINI